MNRVLYLSVFLVLNFCLPSFANVDLESIGTKVNQFLSKNRIPGAILLVSSKDENFSLVSGLANVQERITMQVNNRFNIGSVTKIFTAVVILQLVEENKISLDDNVSKFIPEDTVSHLANATESTIQNLLNHTSGIPDYTGKEYFTALGNDQQNFLEEDLIKFAYDKKPTNETGERFNYSNINYVLLGIIIKNVTGKSLKDIYSEKIFIPANLNETEFGISLYPDKLAHGYLMIKRVPKFLRSFLVNGIKIKDFVYDLTYVNLAPSSDGGIISTVSDLEKFARALFKEEKLLKKESLELLLNNSVKVTKVFSYGLGIEKLIKDDLGEVIGHGGDSLIYQTSLLYLPKQDKIIVVFVNSENLDHRINAPSRLLSKVSKEIF